MIDGFFTQKETESSSRPDGKTYSCYSCGLFRDCSTPKMAPYGSFKKRILNIGSAPTELDDKRAKLWQDKAGRFLQDTYKKLGIDLFEDCLNITANKCSPNKPITNYEIACCRKFIVEVINRYKPTVVILFGHNALTSVIGNRWKKDLGKLSKWRGWTIPDQTFETWICPTYHPDEIITESNRDILAVWENDIKQAVGLLGTPFRTYVVPEIDMIEDLSVLDTIEKGAIAIDYETTGLKPHGEGHRVVCAAVATSSNHSYAFMIPPTKRARQPFLDLLARNRVRKYAHNMKFEEAWSVVRLKRPVINWKWDTMIASHVLDNRPSITGLKFQTYVQFGIIDYASEIAPFLAAIDETNANSLNNVDKLLAKPGGQQKLLKYCGLDTIHTYRLAKLQQNIINPKK